MTVPDRLVRPALEAAVAVARAGEAADPPIKAPPAVRKLLGFARLNRVALAAVRRAVEQDDAFRLRVAGDVDEAELGRASWLWLARPARWVEELEAVAAEMAEADEEARSVREVTKLQRALDAAEQRVGRAEEAHRRAQQDAATARQALTSERDARSAAELLVTSLRAQHARLSEERSAAVRALKEAEAAHGTTRAERRTLRARVRTLEAEVARLDHPTPPPDVASTAASVPAVDAIPDRPRVDVGAVARSVREAASAAAALGIALQRASAELDRTNDAAHEVPATEPPPALPTRVRASPRSRRRPTRLPGAMFEEAPEAAEHLVRLRSAVLLVDGYNVSMAAWPGLAIEHQRDRLVTALDELHARTGVAPLVVFDGVVAGTAAPGTAPRSVRVRFTDAGVEADDVVIGLVDEFPIEQPVVVASSDQRVRDGARRRGANVLTARQMLDVLRR